MNGDNAPGRHEQQSAVNPKLDCLLTLRTYIPTYKTSERHYGNCCNRIKNPFTLGGRGGGSVMVNSPPPSEEEVFSSLTSELIRDVEK